MTTEQIIILLLVLVIISKILADIIDHGRKKKSKGVPDLRAIPPLPIQRYTLTPPTIETQYGRDLLEISTKIYVNNIGASSIEMLSKQSVKAASFLISERDKVCFEIDKERQEKRDKASEEMIAESLQQLSKTGIK